MSTFEKLKQKNITQLNKEQIAKVIGGINHCDSRLFLCAINTPNYSTYRSCAYSSLRGASSCKRDRVLRHYYKLYN